MHFKFKTCRLTLISVLIIFWQQIAFGFYNSKDGRWTTRDPIQETGGENLYTFCDENPILLYDLLGRAHFEVRKLKNTPGIIHYSWFSPLIGWKLALFLDLWGADQLNIEILHEHLFYDDGTNIGYSAEGIFSELSKEGYRRWDSQEYDDCIMKEAERLVEPLPYSLIGLFGPKYNCQDYADDLRKKYDEIKDDTEIKCKCEKVKAKCL